MFKPGGLYEYRCIRYIRHLALIAQDQLRRIDCTQVVYTDMSRFEKSLQIMPLSLPILRDSEEGDRNFLHCQFATTPPASFWGAEMMVLLG